MSNERSAPKTVKDVIFVYTSTTKAVKQLNPEGKAPMSSDPMEQHSYEIKILVSETVFKALKKAFPGAKNFQHARDFTAAECLEKNMTTELEDEDQVLIKFSSTVLRGPATKRVPSPAIKQIGIVGKLADRNGLPITAETNIGNGSKGHFQFNPVKSDFGLYLYPSALCITELVEYVAAEKAGTDFDAFGIEEASEVDLRTEGNDDFEDDIPF